MAAMGSKPLLISRLSNVGCGLFSELYKVPFLRKAATQSFRPAWVDWGKPSDDRSQPEAVIEIKY